MKITKLVHSCVLVETEDRVALFDPGVYSWKSGTFDIDKIDRIDRIIITHPHPDHFHPEFIQTVVDTFPQAEFRGNSAVAKLLKESGINADVKTDSACTKSFEAPHDPVEPFLMTVDNTGFHFQDEFTHPGDSHHFEETKRILAMPLIAPWGSIMDGMKRVYELMPEVVIPIHEYHYTDASQKWAYDILAERFSDKGIKFIVPEMGKTLEV